MTTGEKIAILRKRIGITQEQLAEQLNVTRQSVSRWEMDAAFPEIVKLVKLSKILESSVDFLLNEDMNDDLDNSTAVSIYDCYKFIRECGYFFLATSIDNRPKLRPMSWICSNDKALFIGTDKRKKVYTDMIHNPQIEIASYNLNSRLWIRINGKLTPESSNVVREEMKSMYPLINQEFIEKEEIFFAVFKLNVEKINIR